MVITAMGLMDMWGLNWLQMTAEASSCFYQLSAGIPHYSVSFSLSLPPLTFSPSPCSCNLFLNLLPFLSEPPTHQSSPPSSLFESNMPDSMMSKLKNVMESNESAQASAVSQLHKWTKCAFSMFDNCIGHAFEESGKIY